MAFAMRTASGKPSYAGLAATRDPNLGSADFRYLDHIRSLPILSEQEEADLVRRWYEQGDRAAYDLLIASHLRLVPKIAQKYSGYGISVADLISEGNLGLLHSVERFKAEKGFRFSTYARWWIKASILNYVLHTWSLIKVGNGANKKRLFFNLRRAKRDLQGEGERYLSDADIAKLAEQLRVTREDIVAMDQRLSANDVSLSQPIGHAQDGDAMLVQDTIADEQPNPEERLLEADERAWRAAAVREALAKLDKREQEIVAKRYLSARPATLAKLATLYGLTAERVRQIEAKAIAKIREYLRPKRRGPVLAPA
ncbi:MAG: RNA polymerase factor sigma-32 [Rhodospirillaceae bacterium]|nr:RNA polymerase factor sigma-32 [Rhodospirillaceae bacterium]